MCVTKLLCRSISKSMQKTTLNMAIFALKCFIWLWETSELFKVWNQGIKKCKTIPSIMRIHYSCRTVNKTNMKKQSLFSNISSCLAPSCRKCLASRLCHLWNCQLFLSKHSMPVPNAKNVFFSWFCVIISEKNTRTHLTSRIWLPIKIWFINSKTHNMDQF